MRIMTLAATSRSIALESKDFGPKGRKQVVVSQHDVTKRNEPPYDTLYGEVLGDYCKTHSEDALYRASLLSRTLIEAGLAPDEIVALHYDCMQAVAQDEAVPPHERIRILNDAHQFLLEVMIAYGAQYKEFLDLRLAEALRRAESAELGQREKLEILAMIAHELGNPLTVALGNMQLAVRFLDAQDLANLRELVHNSRDALQRLASLTSQLVAASKGEELSIELEPVDVMRVVTKVRDLEQRVAQEKGVDVRLSTSVDSIWVTGNEEALNSILTNLVSNAVRYTPVDGTVTLSAEERDEEVVLAVADTGIGMDEETRSHIFEKFYRDPHARELEPQGIGMGLAIVHRLVSQQGGRVEVESQFGQGSTFRVILPVYKEEA